MTRTCNADVTTCNADNTTTCNTNAGQQQTTIACPSPFPSTSSLHPLPFHIHPTPPFLYHPSSLPHLPYTPFPLSSLFPSTSSLQPLSFIIPLPFHIFPTPPSLQHPPSLSHLHVQQPISSTSVEPVVGSAASTRPVTPSEQASESSQGQTAPDIDFFFERGSKVPPVTRTLCKTCKYMISHNFIYCTDKHCCLGQMGQTYARVQAASQRQPQMVHCTTTS